MVNSILKKLIIITKLSKKLILMVSFLGILLVGCSNENVISELNSKKITDSSKDKLIVSTFSSENKGDISSLNVNDNTEKILVKDKQVGITGDLSSDESKVAYVDAVGETDPWQIYLHNLNDNETSKITNDKFGKSRAKISDDNFIYFITGSKENVVKVGRVNIENSSYDIDIIDATDSDRQADAFDVKNNKLIISTASRNLELQKWEENGTYVPITHTIFETDLNGNNLKKIAEIQATLVLSISYNYDEKKIIICGCDVNNDSEYGIYELSLDTGELKTILTDNILANTENSIVSEISHPPLATMSRDENLIYFSGVPKNSEPASICGMSCYPTSIFTYNINTKEFKEIFTPKSASLIFDLNINYE
ncbi:S-layer protein [Clostridium botulinum]|nr:S-layer protein [Clostridium botulinum]